MHWFYPPTRMNLIEVIRGIETSDSALDLVMEVAQVVGKETVICERDTQGFITTRLLLLLGLEATRIVDEGIASAEDVNKACRLAFGHAMGPWTRST